MTIITIIIIAIMLMFVYRSIGTVLLTMVILFVGLATGRGVVALLGETGIMGLSTFAVNLLTSLAIAAGTDYAIFMVGRYQEGRERGLDREAAYYDTFAGVSKVVLGSGLTIVGALACLKATRLPYFSSLAFPCAVGLLVVVAAGVTLTPALIVVASGFGLFDPKRRVQLHPLAPCGDGHRAVAGAHPRYFRHPGDRRRPGLDGLQPALQRPVLPAAERFLDPRVHRGRSTLHPGPFESGPSDDRIGPRSAQYHRHAGAGQDCRRHLPGARHRAGAEHHQATWPANPRRIHSVPAQCADRADPRQPELPEGPHRRHQEDHRLPRHSDRPTRAPVHGDPGSRERGGRQLENHGRHGGHHGSKSATILRISTTSGDRFAATSIGRSTASTSRSAGHASVVRLVGRVRSARRAVPQTHERPRRHGYSHARTAGDYSRRISLSRKRSGIPR